MSKWREQFKVHPATDVFPMMSDDELRRGAGRLLESLGVKKLHEPARAEGQ
jgi:hypothetical protein